MIGITERFAVINRLIKQDLNRVRRSRDGYRLFSKRQIAEYLRHPENSEKELRDVVRYIYHVSSHFRRLIQYFVGLSDLAYVVSPFQVDLRKDKPENIDKQYHKSLNMLSKMDIRTQFPEILTVVMREDVYYGTLWSDDKSITLQQLPSEYCYISSKQENVFNVGFDFFYFITREDQLDFFPAEFRERYEAYKKKLAPRYQELNAPESFAIKANLDIPLFAVPPFSGVLRDIYDIEEYRDLKLTKTALENYAMVVMTLGVDAEGNWEIPLERAKQFYHNLDSVLPEEVGSVLSPMPINKISFEKSNTGDSDSVAEAEQNMYSSAGVSSLLFNNTKASANALLLSIKSDQCITYGVVKSIEAMVNRYLHHQSFGKKMRVTFLDVSPFNRKEMGDQYLKACQFGMPMVSYYCASQGLDQMQMETMNFLEDDLLQVKAKFIPLQSSATRSASDNEVGAPEKDLEDLTEAGEQTRELQ